MKEIPKGDVPTEQSDLPTPQSSDRPPPESPRASETPTEASRLLAEIHAETITASDLLLEKEDLKEAELPQSGINHLERGMNVQTTGEGMEGNAVLIRTPFPKKPGGEVPARMTYDVVMTTAAELFPDGERAAEAHPIPLGRVEHADPPTTPEASDPSQAAREAQGTTNYPGRDHGWTNLELNPGFLLVQGSTHGDNSPSGFFTDIQTLIQSGLDANALNRSLQVGAWHGQYRDSVTVYRLNATVLASEAAGRITENVQNGAGGGTEYYLRRDDVKAFKEAGTLESVPFRELKSLLGLDHRVDIADETDELPLANTKSPVDFRGSGILP
jgi:hypothetical protein